ncbi:MAG: hypothetical protein GYB64_07125 [Chloroflexi bacterium]|nr:hypothetical protein [Chloroflexota bacterium]
MPDVRYVPIEQPGQRTVEEIRLAVVALSDSLLANGLGMPVLVSSHAALIPELRAIRASQSQLLSTVIRKGILRISPWYVEPDPVLSSGEALIRNLLFGTAIAAEGQPGPAMLDHAAGIVSQTAQILNGFGIDTIHIQHEGSLRFNGPAGSSLVGLPAASPTDGTPADRVDGEWIRPDGGLTARPLLKHLNRFVEAELEAWAEPFAAWLVALGFDEAARHRDLLRHAWRLLLRQHAYYLLQGVCDDRVAQEALHGLEQAALVAETLASDALQKLAANLQQTEGPPHIMVFNGSRTAQTGLVHAVIPVDAWPFDGWAQIHDGSGTLPLTIDHSDDEVIVLRFVARHVPAFGYRTYRLTATTHPPPGSMVDEGLSIENDLLNVTLDPNDGTITLFDKRTGRSFSGLNLIVDSGDAGDLQAYRKPARDTVIRFATNTPLPVQRRITPTGQSLDVFQIYRLPAALNEDRSARLPLAAQFVPVSIRTRYTITPDVPRVDVDIVVSNDASDHRLRVQFPTGIFTDTVWADSPFDVVARPVSEAEHPYPHQSFLTVLGDETGLTLASVGITESAACMERDGVIAGLTLLRSTGQWETDRGVIAVPNAQELGDQRYRYSLIPHGNLPAQAWQQSWHFQTPLRALLLDGQAAGSGSVATASPETFMITAVKIAEDEEAIVVRGVLLSDEEQTVTLSLGFDFQDAAAVNGNEQPAGSKVSREGERTISVAAAPREIVSVMFTLPH